MGVIKTKVADTLMQPINPSLILLLGIYTALWGFWLANPWWHVFSRAPLYSQMHQYPEWAWGFFAISSGFGIMIGVLIGSNYSLRWGAGIGYFHWLIITGMYFAGDWRNTGGITSLLLCIYCLVVWLNLHKNKHLSRRTRSNRGS